MTYLDSLTGPHGGPCTPANFIKLLSQTENAMYARGWTVIGSVYKASRLHPWKLPNRETIHNWAQADLTSMRANSLNLRLSDTNTIALDCDFTQDDLMPRFLELVQQYLGLSKQDMFMCAGKKGGKLFFRFVPTFAGETPPKSLGPVAFSNGMTRDALFKQEIEVKSDLSTVAGFYGPIDGRMAIYTTYGDYPYIVTANPNDLPAIGLRELQGIEERYLNLLCSVKGMVDEWGAPIDRPERHALLYAAACSYIHLSKLQLESEHQEATVDAVLRHATSRAFYADLMEPWLKFLGQNEACELIEALFFGAPTPMYSMSPEFETICVLTSPANYWLTLKECEVQYRVFCQMTQKQTDRIRDMGRGIGLFTERLAENPPLLLKEVKAAYNRHVPDGVDSPAVRSLKMAAMALE